MCVCEGVYIHVFYVYHYSFLKGSYSYRNRTAEFLSPYMQFHGFMLSIALAKGANGFAVGKHTQGYSLSLVL